MEQEQTDIPDGEWAGLRYRFLQEERPEELKAMIESGELYRHLEQIEDHYNDKMWDMIEAQMEREHIDNAYKARDPIGWAGHANRIRWQISEVFREEICS